jgi:membrane protein implicated in regulation of membrane protease activity
MDMFLSAWLVWFILGIVLAFVELIMPGFIVIFFGVGCWAVAGVLLIVPLTAAQQVLLFIAATIVSIVLLRKWSLRIFRGGSSQAQKDYDDFPAGARAQVVERISPQARGRIQFRGSFWDAASDEEIEKDQVVEILRFVDDSHQVYFVKKPLI